MSQPTKRKYWIRFYTEYCPICGFEDSWRERVYYDKEPKPDEDRFRYIWKEVYDYCDVF